MPVEAIVRICSTVAIVQVLCNVAANSLVFHRRPYKEASERLVQATKAKQQLQQQQARGGKEAASVKGGKSDKKSKHSQRVDEEHGNALALVTGMHLLPNVVTSIVFFVLMKIFGTEFKGAVVGVLPFTPFKFLQRFTARGLDFGDNAVFEGTDPAVTDLGQACSLMFIYFLSTVSVKFYVNKLFGTPPPPGADGLNSLLDTPVGKRLSDEYMIKEE